jgi:hypothetical protein
MTPADVEHLSLMLDRRADTNDAYRSAVSTGTIFWALGVLREVLGLVAAEHEENREALVDVLCAWCTALRTRPRPRHGLLDRVAATAVASFLSDVADVRGTFREEKLRDVVDAVRTHVACVASNRPRPICFCRVRGCERNEHFVRYVLTYAGVSPDGCDSCPVRPLHYALGTKNDFMVRELVARGADVNATGPGLSTSMHWAATAEHMLVVLKAGFRPGAMAAVTNGGTVREYHAKRGTGAELRAAVALFKSSPPSSVSTKRRRVSIEVVPREELCAHL